VRSELASGERRLSDHPAAAAIETRDLRVGYGGEPVLEGLNLTVPAGSVFGLLGPNGAGKTTLIKTLLGLRRPHGGEARVLGYDAVRESLEVRARVGYVGESGGLYDRLTVSQMCAFCRVTARRWEAATVDRYLDLFGLPRRARVGRLSKGMKGQLALCLAMGGDPEVLVLDEPTSGFDPVARHEFLATLVGEVAAAGKTVFFSTHVLAEVEAAADGVAVLRDGALALSGEVDRLREAEKLFDVVCERPLRPAEVAALRALPHVVGVRQEWRLLRVRARGDVAAVEGALRARFPDPRDVRRVDLGLEQILLEHMRGREDAG
jgi:ABC-2 type transport system ATP-binding protein